MRCRHWSVGVSAVWLLCALAAPAADAVEEKYESGQLKLKYGVDDEGRKDGLYHEYYEDGKPKLKATYKSGELEGAWTSYHPSGKANITASYKAGKLNGPYSEQTDKGLKRLSAVYRAGKLHGALTQSEKGRASFTTSFADGELAYGKKLEAMKKKLAEIIGTPATRKDDPAAALRRLKAYRYLCDLPYASMVLDDEMNRYALAGSKLCAKIGRLDHKPANPGLPEAEYKFAYKGTSNSNFSSGDASLASAVDGWMDDSDSKNIDHLGHRRWCLSPRMQKVGFGRTGIYSAMWVFDESLPSAPNFDFIAYPARGNMPIEYFGPRHAWSVLLHPKKYGKPDRSVKPRVFEVDPLLNKLGDSLKLRHASVHLEDIVFPSCIIFQPEKLVPAAGKRYLVEIDGLRRVDGRASGTLRYVVEFVTLK
jgi:hypothetical protein